MITNGMGRGVIPGGHPLLATKARSVAFGQCDLAVVVGAPLDFRLGYGRFGGKEGASARSGRALRRLSEQLSRNVELAGVGVRRSPPASSSDPARGVLGQPTKPDWIGLDPTAARDRSAAAAARDAELLAADADPIHPGPHLRRARRRGSLTTRWSSATGATSCRSPASTSSRSGLAAGSTPVPTAVSAPASARRSAARIARPSAQIVLLLGDGAAGMSLMDVDTLVRHDLPVVMVVGNNSCWGLEKHPMQFLFGYDVAAELGHQTSYDKVAQALGGDGETVSKPETIGAALDRAFAAEAPYLVNVLTDPESPIPGRRRRVNVAAWRSGLARDDELRRVGSSRWTPTSPMVSSPPTTTTPTPARCGDRAVNAELWVERSDGDCWRDGDLLPSGLEYREICH